MVIQKSKKGYEQEIGKIKQKCSKWGSCVVFPQFGKEHENTCIPIAISVKGTDIYYTKDPQDSNDKCWRDDYSLITDDCNCALSTDEIINYINEGKVGRGNSGAGI